MKEQHEYPASVRSKKWTHVERFSERAMTEEEYDRMVEHLESACSTCVYGFPEAIGHSCGVTKKIASDVIVKCGAYRKQCGE